MRTIIAGSRDIDEIKYVIQAIKLSKFKITEVICGGARGPDTQGKNWAFIHDIPVNEFLPDWNTSGKNADFIRNEKMVKNVDALILIWDGESKGSKHMLNLAMMYNLKIFVLIVKPNGEIYVPVL